MSIKDAIYKKIIFHIINDNSFLYKQAIKEYVSHKTLSLVQKSIQDKNMSSIILDYDWQIYNVVKNKQILDQTNIQILNFTKQDIGTTLSIGMGVSAVLILIPRMVTVMMEGLTALGNAASAYMKSKMGDDAEIYIGMDIALGLGDPCCITSTVIAIPCVILMAFIIPNMTYFPIGLLTIVCYVTPMCVMASKGNLFRSIVTTILCLFLVTFLTNFFAPEATLMMKTTGVHISGMVTDGFFGQNPICILIGFIHRIIG